MTPETQEMGGPPARHTGSVSPDPTPAQPQAGGADSSGGAGSSGGTGSSGGGYWQGTPPPAQPWETGLGRGREPGVPTVPARDRWEQATAGWGVEIALAAGILLLCLSAFTMRIAQGGRVMALTGLIIAAAFRRAPVVGLIAAAVSTPWLLTAATPLVAVTSAMALFAAMRFGGRPTRLLAVLITLSLPIAGVAILEGQNILRYVDAVRAQAGPAIPWRRLVSELVGPALVWLLVIVAPVVAGSVTRRLAESRTREEQAQHQQAQAERERSYAQQVADLKAGQAQLARDVHDVVGHSLAVILAQAESAQYLKDDETDKMRETLSNVATSARRSLQDVRQVLSPSSTANQPPATGLDALIDGVATAGNEVRRTTVGAPRPLPPDLEQVAYRVLQEMLTNALKHGRRGGPVWVEQEWPADWKGAYLRIEVRNLVDEGATGALPTGRPSGGGLGLEGMRYRLESVGGQFDTASAADAGGTVFTATAWLPLRAAEVDLEGTR